MAKIVAMLPGGRRKTFYLTQSTMSLGRSETCDIPLPTEPKASRKHLQISHIAGVISIEDLQSANGTWFHGERISRRKIEDRDILSIGETRLQFLFDDDAKPDPPKSRKKRGLATIDTDQVIEFLANGNWKPVDEPTPYVEMLDGESRGLKISFKSPIVMGRASTCEVVLEGKKVSNTHTRFEMMNGVAFVKDLGSTNGTLHNTYPLQPQIPKELHHGDIVDVGDNRFVFRIPPELRVAAVEGEAPAEAAGIDRSLIAKHALIFLGGPRKGERVNMAEKVTIGRHSYNTLPLEGGKVSNYHAEIVVAGKQFQLRDLQSTNGTFLNGKAVSPKKPMILDHEDIINIGDHVLAFEEAGTVLDLDGRIARIRRKMREKVAFAFLRGVLVLTFAVVMALFVTEQVVKLIPPPADPNVTPTKPMASNPAPLSFEFDPAKPGVIPGWKLSAEGQTCEIGFEQEPDFIQGGRYSLRLIPSGGVVGQSRITLSTDSSLTLTRTGTALRVGAWVRIEEFKQDMGLVGMRVVWNAGSADTPVTVVWLDSSEITKGQWQRIEGKVSAPPNSTPRFGLEFFVEGVATKFWVDEITAEADTAEGEAPTLQIARMNLLGAEFDGPARLKISAGNPRRQLIDRLEPVMLVRTSLGDSSTYSVFQRAGTAGPISLAEAGDRGAGRDAQYSLYGPASKRRQGLGMKILPHPSPDPLKETLELERTLYDVELAETEALALEMVMNVGTVQTPYRLQIFNEGTDEITPPANFTGLLASVAEIVWGTHDGARELGIRMNPPGRVYVQGGEQTKLYLLLAEGKGGVQPLLTLRPFASKRQQAAEKLLAEAAQFERSATQLGDALLLLQEGLSRYDGFLDYGRTFRRKIQELDVVRGEIFDVARTQVDSLQSFEIRGIGDAQMAIGYINEGLRACEEYRRRYRALVDELRQIEAWFNYLQDRRRLVEKIISQSSRAEREAVARQLVEEARKWACITKPADVLDLTANFRPKTLNDGVTISQDCSTIRARLYAEQVVNFYSDITEHVRNAQLIIDAIERLWQSEDAGFNGPAAIAVREFDATNGRFVAKHYFNIRLALARWPNSPHRVDLMARMHWYQAEQKIIQNDNAAATRLFLAAVSYLPKPEPNAATNTARQNLRAQIERRAIGELKLDLYPEE